MSAHAEDDDGDDVRALELISAILSRRLNVKTRLETGQDSGGYFTVVEADDDAWEVAVVKAFGVTRWQSVVTLAAVTGLWVVT